MAQGADISMSSLERDYGTFLGKAIQKKVQRKCDRIGRKTEA